MNETYKVEIAPNLSLTIVALTERHYWRVHSVPPVVSEPVPPEGYSVNEALELVASYKEKHNEYLLRNQNACIWRAVGAARLNALEDSTLTEQIARETAALQPVLTRYSFMNPDKQTDPLVAGMAIAEIAGERTGTTDAINRAYLWLSEKAGGISHDQVEEWLKSIRPESQRDTAVGSSGDSVGADTQGNAAAENVGVENLPAR